MKKYKLLTQEEYNKTNHKVPYFFEISNEKQKLYYIGSRHSYDINHPQYDFIKNKFEEFISNVKNDILMISETKVYDKYNTAEEAVSKSGDAGYAYYLSNKHSIEITCVEPDKAEELEFLLENYTKEQITYYHFSRVVSQFIRSNESFTKNDFEVYAKRFMLKYQKQFNWFQFDFSLDNMYEIHKSIFNRDFDLDEKEFLRKIPWPTLDTSVINEVSRDSSYFRDEYIVKQIEKYWGEGKNLFVIYGSSHAVIQEPAIRDFVSK